LIDHPVRRGLAGNAVRAWTIRLDAALNQLEAERAAHQARRKLKECAERCYSPR
jgi:hypothetical protein